MGLPRTINRKRLADSLYFNLTDAESYLEGSFKVPYGAVLSVTDLQPHNPDLRPRAGREHLHVEDRHPGVVEGVERRLGGRCCAAAGVTADHAVVGDREDTPGATKERRHAYLREAPEMLEFLIGKGIQFNRAPYWPDYYTNAPGASEEGRTVLADLFDINQLGEWVLTTACKSLAT